MSDMPIRFDTLLKNYRENKQVFESRRITFKGVEGFDVYNISAPFESGGKTYIAGRVEKRDSEISCVMFFEKESDAVYRLDERYRIDMLQDPSVCFINGELILCGTKIYEGERITSWNTAFYRGDGIATLEHFFDAPQKMKDVRLCALKDGRIIAFTRPQGQKGGRGKIGYAYFDSLDSLNRQALEDAPIITSHFIDEEWGGANEVHLLRNGLLGVLGHIAKREENGNLFYCAMTFAFDTEKNKSGKIKIIAEKRDFGETESKRPDLVNVVFSGGIRRLSGGRAALYAGVSDAEAHLLIIKDPFSEYEA